MKHISILLCAALLALGTANEASAWGRLGHKTIAEIAQRHLTPKAKAEIEKYTRGTPLAAYAIFMDSVVKKPIYVTEFRGWHASIADASCKSPAEVRNKYRKGRDGVTAMEYWRKELANRDRLSDSTVLCGIKCIVHIIADFHCPAHARYADNKNDGHIKVTFFGKKTTLHKVWDTALITHSHKGWTYKRYADYLDSWSKGKVKRCTRGNEQAWFEDAARDVRPTLTWVNAGDTLDEKFEEKALPLAELQMRKAAYQLATALNQIFGE